MCDKSFIKCFYPDNEAMGLKWKSFCEYSGDMKVNLNLKICSFYLPVVPEDVFFTPTTRVYVTSSARRIKYVHIIHIFLGDHLWIPPHSCRTTSIVSAVTLWADDQWGDVLLGCMWSGGGWGGLNCYRHVKDIFGVHVHLFYPPWRVEINTTLSWSCSS